MVRNLRRFHVRFALRFLIFEITKISLGCQAVPISLPSQPFTMPITMPMTVGSIPKFGPMNVVTMMLPSVVNQPSFNQIIRVQQG